jgi:hypothetical protein
MTEWREARNIEASVRAHVAEHTDGSCVECFGRRTMVTILELLDDARAALAGADSAAPGKPVMSVAMSDADEGPA